MRKDFYIFRHGETDLNKDGRRQGQKIDAELNETGIKQACDLAEKLTNVGLDIIYSSSLKRAKKTAEIVAEKLSIPVEFDENLKEGCFGIFEGLYSHEVKEKYAKEHELWESLDEKDFDYCLPYGESKREMSNRMHNVLEGLLNTKFNKIAISTHGRITRLYLYRHGMRLTCMENAAVYHVVYDNGKWFVVE